MCRGQAQHGELGYGPEGKKSSANPDKCMALEGVTTHQVLPTSKHALCSVINPIFQKLLWLASL
jgi:hypothetical protein